MSNEYLLGATTDHEIVTCNLRLEDNGNGSSRFTASFNVYNLISENDFDSYVESYLDSADKETLYDLCDDYDCAPSALLGIIVDSGQAEEFINMDWCINTWSLSVNDVEWYFENVCCGQHDTRNEMGVIIDQEAYDLVHELWNSYHMKAIGGDTLAQAEALIAKLEEIDEEKWIANYIEEHLA